MGERISILFRISGDPDHPFSEVTGVLMRIEQLPGIPRALHVIRRSGEVVVVSEQDIVKCKLMAGGAGAWRTPAAWEADRLDG